MMWSKKHTDIFLCVVKCQLAKTIKNDQKQSIYWNNFLPNI